MLDYKTKRRLDKMRRKASDSRSRLFYILRGVAISVAITIPVIFAVAGASYITDFPEEYISPISFAAMMLSVFLSAFISSAWQKNCGWSNGTLIGGIYMLCIVALRSILEERVCFDKDSVTIILFGLLIGSLSGYAGFKFMKVTKSNRNR